MEPYAVPDGWELCSKEEATHAYDDYTDVVLILEGNDEGGIVVGRESVLVEDGFESDRYYPVRES